MNQYTLVPWTQMLVNFALLIKGEAALTFRMQAVEHGVSRLPLVFDKEHLT